MNQRQKTKQDKAQYVILGGGLAGATAARTLREQGATGRIVVVSEESILPYHRPPLSKPPVSPDQAFTPAVVLDEKKLTELHIEVLLGERATQVNPKLKTIVLSNAPPLAYEKLLIATGASPTPLNIPGQDLKGVHYLRTFDQAVAIREQAKRAKHAVVIGGSFNGVEAAAMLRKLGVTVTLIESKQLLYKLYAPKVSKYFEAILTKNDVQCLVPDRPLQIKKKGRGLSVQTQDGHDIACELVVIGAGVTPRVEFLEGSGIICEDGVKVNEYLQTNDPDIYAAGDVANTSHPLYRQHLRVEHWDNAIKQARLAARNMLGRHEPYTKISYFFSHVFDQSFTLVGIANPTDEHIERGSLKSEQFETLYLQDNVPTAFLALGRATLNTRAAEGLIRSHANLSSIRDRLSDPKYSLSDIPGQILYVLQGGGAYGAFECGAIRALQERDIRPDVVAGVSIGAFNGAIIASHPDNPAQALERFWRELSMSSVKIPDESARRSLASQQVSWFGVPGFFSPRWLNPWQSLGQLPSQWPSLYDFSPARDLLQKHVDFKALKSSPIRLLVTAVDVQTSKVVLFDSYLDDLTVDHVLASGSLPPAFPWITIEGRHYWDAGIISNSPLEPALGRIGSVGKQVYLIDLFTGQRQDLPETLQDVYARREEIIFSQRVSDDYALQNRLTDYQQLVRQLMAQLPETSAQQVRQEPLYLQLMGQAAATTITQIVRHRRGSQNSSKSYDFSAPTIEQLIEDGYQTAVEVLATRD
jgi:NADPH-dependent 2,4-dienoyl-CoA reductase/sulfur reductase-like enzyme/predicted acylesterase/phospholipase RssA